MSLLVMCGGQKARFTGSETDKEAKSYAPSSPKLCTAIETNKEGPSPSSFPLSFHNRAPQTPLRVDLDDVVILSSGLPLAMYSISDRLRLHKKKIKLHLMSKSKQCRTTGRRRIGGKLVLAPVHQGGQRSGEHLQGLIYGFFFAEDVGVPSSGYLSLWNPATRRGRRSGCCRSSQMPWSELTGHIGLTG